MSAQAALPLASGHINVGAAAGAPDAAAGRLRRAARDLRIPVARCATGGPMTLSRLDSLLPEPEA